MTQHTTSLDDHSPRASCKNENWLRKYSPTSCRWLSGMSRRPLAPTAHCLPSLVVTTAA
jgi:hypothetical protein